MSDPERVVKSMRSAADGDQRGWDALVDEFGAMIRGVARSHRLSDVDAADVTQATWLALVEHVTRINDPARVAGWLATTARREAVRVVRDGKRRVPLRDDVPELESTDAPLGDALIRSERDRALWHGFAQLRPSDQELLKLTMTDPRPAYEDISVALEMPVGSIGPTRQRALERLRRELDRQGSLSLLAA
jgi:RNA polymerase sigma factor (sigma-70 family)